MADRACPLILNAVACEFPGAHDPAQLHRNLMDRRREFRAMPADRLDLGAYARGVQVDADTITDIQVALISDWAFDLSRFQVPRSTFDNTDMTHWLALDLAARALTEAGGVEGLDRDRTAVVVANTLTGEFSRAALTRLRLPFLDALLQEALEATDLRAATDPVRQAFAERLRGAFPDPNEDMLAGGLANTIAGRIANQFDLRGGAYSVDGACASSLVAMSHAATLLATGRVDHVLVGAVDLSLDPFELVGFSRNGALAADRMRVFDQRAAGFWPGEGGAMMLVSRAHSDRLPERARLVGWGMSSDGAGGLTRPDSGGQFLACQRAMDSAGIASRDLAYVEAHGTGTAVGDPTEVRALARIAAGRTTPLPVGSIKANIGHTKAAAGFAGMTKALMALQEGRVPPHVGCVLPSSVFAESKDAVYPALSPVDLDPDAANVIGVSSFGFGGINTHVLMAPAAQRAMPRTRGRLHAQPRALDAEAELFLLAEADRATMATRLDEIRDAASNLSLARLGDACHSYSRPAGDGPVRLAFAARTGSEAADRARAARHWVENDCAPDARPDWLFWGEGAEPDATVGFVFPGQAAPVLPPGGPWSEAFPEVDDLVRALARVPKAATARTDIAQPLITLANLQAMQVLAALGITPDAVVGHSLGEISALAACGALTVPEALRLAEARGAIMQREGIAGGGMIRVETDADTAAMLCKGTAAVLACANGPGEIVIGGQPDTLTKIAARSAACGIGCATLKVSHAFHTADMAPAADSFARALAKVTFAAPRSAEFWSTVSGAREHDAAQLPDLLVRQLTAKVEFERPIHAMANTVDLMIEVGSGTGMTRLCGLNGVDAWALDFGGDSFDALHRICAAAHCAGVGLNLGRLHVGRGHRPFDAMARPLYLTNPCGRRAKNHPSAPTPSPAQPIAEPALSLAEPMPDFDGATDVETVVRAMIAAETGFDPDKIDLDARFQTRLNMNSLSVARVVAKVTRQLRLPVAGNPADFSDANAEELIGYLAEIARNGISFSPNRVEGAGRWVRRYAMEWHAVPASFDAGGAPIETVLNVPADFTVEAAGDLLEQIQQAVASGERDLAVIEDGCDLSAFMRSIWHEGHFARLVLIDRNGQTDRAEDLMRLTSPGRRGFRHVRLMPENGICAPRFAPVPARPPFDAHPPADTLLAIGCARGIGVECALRMAGPGTHVVFAGRSAPDHPAVAATLNLAAEWGVSASYEKCDICDPASVETLSKRLRGAKRTPGDLLFAPAVNTPAGLTSLSREKLAETLAPKWTGFANVLDWFGAGLGTVVTFGSIIGRIGLEGEAHYALANARQARLAEEFAARMPDARVLTLEWTVWSGAGMGERMGVIDRLAAQGVDALDFDAALVAFDRALADGCCGTICLTSRFGAAPSLDIGETQAAPRRFLQTILVDYPGVELVAEARLRPGRDLYLDGHRIDGAIVLPGVAGIEAMAQAAEALRAGAAPARVSDVTFHRPFHMADQGGAIRVAAILGEAGEITASVFGDDDDFCAPFMTCSFPAEGPAPLLTGMPPLATMGAEFALQDLYGGALFFHDGRFALGQSARMSGSRGLSAKIAHSEGPSFCRLEPAQIAFWPIEIADAALHLLQLAVPQGRVLPVSLGSIEIAGDLTRAARIEARENYARDGEYSFDSVILDADGTALARINDGRFRRVGALNTAHVTCLSPELAGALLERGAREQLGMDGLRVAMVHDPEAGRQARRAAALAQLGLTGHLKHGADGTPRLTGVPGFISFAHSGCFTLAVYAETPLACDLESATAEPVPDQSIDDWLRQEMASKLKCLSRGRDTAPDDLPIEAWLTELPAFGLRAGIGRPSGEAMRASARSRTDAIKETGYA